MGTIHLIGSPLNIEPFVTPIPDLRSAASGMTTERVFSRQISFYRMQPYDHPATSRTFVTFVMPWLDHGIHAVSMPPLTALRDVTKRHGLPDQVRQ